VKPGRSPIEARRSARIIHSLAEVSLYLGEFGRQLRRHDGRFDNAKARKPSLWHGQKNFGLRENDRFVLLVLCPRKDLQKRGLVQAHGAVFSRLDPSLSPNCARRERIFIPPRVLGVRRKTEPKGGGAEDYEKKPLDGPMKEPLPGNQNQAQGIENDTALQPLLGHDGRLTIVPTKSRLGDMIAASPVY